jgi:AcrR family transcriptional regulator
MGIQERRERERIELRAKILDVARDLFAKEGYEAVTMRKIAEKIEYSPTAIYLHFKDKDELIRELCQYDFRRFAARFSSTASVEDPLERLRATGRIYFDFAAQCPEQYRLMFMTARPDVSPEDGERDDPAINAYAFLRYTVTEALEKKLLRPELTDPELLAQTIWAATHGVASLEIIFGAQKDGVDFRPLAERQTQLIDFILHALLREPRAERGKSPRQRPATAARVLVQRRQKRG